MPRLEGVLPSGIARQLLPDPKKMVGMNPAPGDDQMPMFFQHEKRVDRVDPQHIQPQNIQNVFGNSM